jgi:resuscitation-promoting factor RpfA
MTQLVRRSRALGVSGAIGALIVVELLTATGAAAATPSFLQRIKQCESGGNYTAVNPTSGASGAYQFIDSTWRSLSASAGYATAASAPVAVQDAAALELYNEEGTAPWNSSISCWASSGSLTTASTSTATTPTTSPTTTKAPITTTTTTPIRLRPAVGTAARWDPVRIGATAGGACGGGAGAGFGRGRGR